MAQRTDLNNISLFYTFYLTAKPAQGKDGNVSMVEQVT
jgi:hypothetical protein